MPRPREPPVFFIDHCLGTEKVARRLRREGVDARVLVDDGFAESSDDIAWLPVVAAKGWAVLTKDQRIRRRAIEHQAIWIILGRACSPNGCDLGRPGSLTSTFSFA